MFVFQTMTLYYILLQTHLTEVSPEQVEKKVTTVTESGSFENKGVDIELTEMKPKVETADDGEDQKKSPLHVDTRTKAQKERPDEPPDEEVGWRIIIA